MKIKFFLTILVFLLISTNSSGTTLSKLSIEDLYEYSDFVGLIELSQGQTLGTGEDSCGALYNGSVIKQFKGDSKKTIKFGHFYGFEIGGKYLVFLSKPGEEKRFLNSTNGRSEKNRQEMLKRCAEEQTGWGVMHSGAAAIKQEYSIELKYKDGFAIKTKYIKMPEELNAVEGEFDNKEKYSGKKWFKSTDVLTYLSKLNQNGD